MAILYHLTCISHFKKIWSEDQFLKVTESNIGSPDSLKPDPDDPDYESDLVPIWPKSYRKTSAEYDPSYPTPMAAPGSILKQMEENSERWSRVTHEQLRDMGSDDDTIDMNIIVEWSPSGRPPVKFGEHVGPDVVWLTCDCTPTQDWQTAHRVVDPMWRKDEILFVVEVPDEDLRKWSKWAFEHGISQFWYDALNNEYDDAANWYVVEREIPKSEWVAIYMAKSGKVVWLDPDRYPDLPADVFHPTTGLILKEREPEISALYPKPEVYFAAAFKKEMG